MNPLFTFESQDTYISHELLNVYGDDITKEQLDIVLEFDKSNSEALYKLARILDKENVSLFYPLKILEQSGIASLGSKQHYISILYRLGRYFEVVETSNKMDIYNITNADTLFYISDSLIRVSQEEIALVVLASGLHQFPEDIRFHELRYLLLSDSESLSFIRRQEDNISSLFRLYNRVVSKRSKSLLYKIIRRTISTLTTDEVENLQASYNLAIINDFIKYIDKEKIKGRFLIDIDSNTFSDGFVDVENGKIIRNSRDKDKDGKIDLEYIYIDGNFKEITDDKNKILYTDYPFVNKIEIGKIKKNVYSFHNNKVSVKVDNQLEPKPLMDISDMINYEYLRKVESFTDDELVKVIIYRNNKTEIIYLEPHANGWGHCLLVRNSVILSGVRDMDSDGFYEIHEEYSNGVLTGSYYIQELTNNRNEKLNNWWK